MKVFFLSVKTNDDAAAAAGPDARRNLPQRDMNWAQIQPRI